MPIDEATRFERILRESVDPGAGRDARPGADRDAGDGFVHDLVAWVLADQRRVAALLQGLEVVRPLVAATLGEREHGPTPPADADTVLACGAAALARSARGFAIVDDSGRIVHANAQLGALLGLADPIGAALADFFSDDGTCISELLGRSEPHALRRRTLKTANGAARIVTCEFGRVAAGAESYSVALLADVTQFVKGDLAGYEAADFGVIRTDASERSVITYANPYGAKLLGGSPDDVVGRPAGDLFPSATDHATLAAQRRLRSTGRATPYTLHLPRPNGEPRPLLVAAFPEYSPTDGERIGTLAVVQSLEKPALRDRLHSLIEQHGDRPHALLTSAMTTIQEFLPHSFAVFTIYEDEWAWPAHLEPRPADEWPTRWFRLPPSIRNWMANAPDQQHGGTLVDDLAHFFEPFADGGDLAEDEVTRHLVEDGHRAVMSLPFRAADKQWLGSLSLFRKDGARFAPEDLDIAKEIGLVALVQSALSGFKRREEEFANRLREQVRRGRDLTSACRELVDLLCPYFRWQHVSIFACEYRDQRFELVAQKRHTKHGFLLDEGFSQAFDVGVMGLAFRERRAVVVNDTADGSPEAAAFARQHARTQATMVLPVRLDGRVLLLINAEDSRKNSFSPGTRRRLERFVQELEDTLHAMLDRRVVHTMEHESASGILLVDRFGTIWKANDKARLMLGLVGDEPAPENLATVLPTPLERSAALDAVPVDGFRVALACAGGGRRHALMYTAFLEDQTPAEPSPKDGAGSPHAFGFRLVYFTDLQRLRWQHDVAALKSLVGAFARETRPTLVHAHTSLDRLARDVQAGRGDEARRRIAELREALAGLELTYQRASERLGPSDQAKPETAVRLDLGELVRDALGRCTDARVQAADEVKAPDERLYVEGVRSRLAFVFETIFKYAVSRRARERPARLKLSRRRGTVSITLNAALGERLFTDLDSITRTQRLAGQVVTLNETLIREIVESEHGGTYRHGVRVDGRSRFEIRLPQAAPAAQE